jgi:hypothetical protein
MAHVLTAPNEDSESGALSLRSRLSLIMACTANIVAMFLIGCDGFLPERHLKRSPRCLPLSRVYEFRF